MRSEAIVYQLRGNGLLIVGPGGRAEWSLPLLADGEPVRAAAARLRETATRLEELATRVEKRPLVCVRCGKEMSEHAHDRIPILCADGQQFATEAIAWGEAEAKRLGLR